jgi:hypothetical protein
MPTRLYQIEIFCSGTKQVDASGNWIFHRAANYICDYYHQMLFGYNPPSTKKISIIIGAVKNVEEPYYYNCMCNIARSFDEEAFSNLPQGEKHRFLLTLVHNCCLELIEKFRWQKAPFEKAYDEILKRNLLFVIDYPEKQSRDKKKTAHLQVCKTEDVSTLQLIVSLNGETKQVMLVQKKNWFWWDSVYEMAKGGKWVDSSTFIMEAKSRNKSLSYSTVDDIVTGDNDFSGIGF